MSRWKPCKRREFIRRLHKLGFIGPFAGTRHEFVTYAGQRLTVPSNEEYSIPQLRMMIREVEDILERQLTLAEWDQL